MKKRVFVDMDGVLCEYNKVEDPKELEVKGYFRNLNPLKDNLEAVKKLAGSDEYDVYVLSAVIPAIRAEATREKNEWLDEHLPVIGADHRIFTLCGENKADAVGELNGNDVLCDDYSLNLRNWCASGGKGIKILNGINGTNGTYVQGPRLSISGEDDLVNTIGSLFSA
jgi:5'(3')-deoxyribonucleotidase